MAGWKDLLFESESSEQPIEADTSFSPVPEITHEKISDDPIDKDSPIGKLTALLTILESQLPDKKLRFSVAITTLQAQGINKIALEKDIVATQARINQLHNDYIAKHNDKEQDLKNLVTEHETMLANASRLAEEITTTQRLLTEEKAKDNATIEKLNSAIFDIAEGLKTV